MANVDIFGTAGNAGGTTSSGPSKGSGGGVDIFGGGGAAKPSINDLLFHGPKSAGVLDQFRNAIMGAPKAVVGLGSSAVHELSNDVGAAGHSLSEIAHGHLAGAFKENLASYHAGEPGGLAQYTKEHPLSGSVGESFGRTGSRLGQTLVAVGEGHPTRNPYTQIARGHRPGQTIVSAILEDLANVTAPLEGAGKLAEGAAGDAAAEQTAAEAAAKEAAKGVTEAQKGTAAARLRQAAAPLDTDAAVQAARAESAARTAGEAHSGALADVASKTERAQRLAKIAEGIQTVAHAGNKAAASPFAPFDIAGRAATSSFVREQLLKPLMEHIGETGVGEKLSAASEKLSEMRGKHEEALGLRRTLGEMHNEEARAAAPIAREVAARKEILGGDKNLMAAHEVYMEGIAPTVVRAAESDPVARDAVIQSLANRAGVEPEAAAVALDVAAGKNPELKAKFDKATGNYRTRAEQPMAENYIAGKGEPKGAPPEHYSMWNVEGTNVEPQGKVRGRLEAAQFRRDERAGVLANAQKGYETELGRQPGLPRDPAALVRAVHGPLVALARHLVDLGADEWSHWTDDPYIGPAIKRLQSGVAPERVVGGLADGFLRALDAKPGNLSPNMAHIVDLLHNQAMPGLETVPEGKGIAAATPRLGALAPAEQSARAGERVNVAQERVEAAANLLGKSYDQLDAAQQRMADRIASDPRVVAASNAAEKAGARLGSSIDKLRAAMRDEKNVDPYKAADMSPQQLAREIKASREALKQVTREHAAALEHELHEADALTIGKPPYVTKVQDIRKGERKGQTAPVRRRANEGEWEGWEDIPNSIRGNPRYVQEGGQSISEAMHNWQQFRGGARAGSQMGGVHGENAPSAAEWVDTIQKIEQLRKAANVDAEKGWGRQPITPPAKGGLFGSKSRIGEAPPYPDAGAELLGMPHPGTMEEFLHGTPREAADRVVGALAKEVRAMHTEPAFEGLVGDKGGIVTEAIARGLEGERNPQARLGEGARATFATEKAGLGALGAAEKSNVAKGRLGALSDENMQRARERGQAEGTQLGRAQEGVTIGKAEQKAADRTIAQNARLAGQLPENQVEAAARVAGRVGRKYYEAGERGRALRDAATTLRVSERSLQRADTMLQREAARAAADISSAPSRYRPMLHIARGIAADLEDMANEADKGGTGAGDILRAAQAEVIVNLKDAHDAGINPPHMIGGEAKTPGTLPSSSGELPRQRSTGNRKAKTGATATRSDSFERSRLLARRAVQQVRNEYVQRIGDTFGTKARAVLGDERHQEILNGGGKAFTGQELVDAAHAHDLEVWDPTSAFPKPVKAASAISKENIDDLVLLPTHLIREAGRPGSWGLSDTAVIRAYDAMSRGTKTAWLGLSGRYYVGRLVGHTVLSIVGGGIDPITLWRHMANAKAILGQGATADEGVLSRLSPKVRGSLDEGAFVPAELQNRGEISAMFPKAVAQDAAKFYQHPMRWSHQFTNTVDNIANAGLYMANIERGLTDRGLADFVAKYPDFKGMPLEQVQREAAIRLTLRVLGDFKDMRPVEREILSRVVFFYPWIRHVTRMTANLAIHNPLRAVWALHLADMFNGQPDTGVPWLNSAIPLGHGNFLRTPATFNPFAHIAQLSPSGDNALDPSGLLGTISPLIQGAVGAATGLDIRKGAQISRPPGSGNLTAAGSEAPTSLLTPGRWGELGNYLGGLVPQIAAAREAIPALRGHEPVVRYPTGEAIHNQLHDLPTDQVTPGGRSLARLTQLLGIPYSQHVEVANILKMAEERRGRAAAQRRSYARGGKKKPAAQTSANNSGGGVDIFGG